LKFYYVCKPLKNIIIWNNQFEHDNNNIILIHSLHELGNTQLEYQMLSLFLVGIFLFDLSNDYICKELYCLPIICIQSYKVWMIIIMHNNIVIS